MSSDIDQQLLDAIRSDSFAKVRDAIKAGADVNVRGSNNRTPLHYAAALARSAIVQLLLDQSANADLDDDEGMTPLHAAIIAKKFAQAETLLEAGANINFQSGKRPTPLCSAFYEDLRHDETERSAFLIKKGADTSVTIQRNAGEWTVFEIARDMAAQFTHAEVILQAMYKHLAPEVKEEEVMKEVSEDAIELIRKSAIKSKKNYRL